MREEVSDGELFESTTAGLCQIARREKCKRIPPSAESLVKDNCEFLTVRACEVPEARQPHAWLVLPPKTNGTNSLSLIEGLVLDVNSLFK